MASDQVMDIYDCVYDLIEDPNDISDALDGLIDAALDLGFSEGDIRKMMEAALR